MNIGRQAASRIFRQSILCGTALFLASCLPSIAQTPAASSAPQSTPAISSPPPPAPHGIITLDGPWRFLKGDDLRWAEPDFDDSNWPVVSLSQTLGDQGFEPYTGYAWYRMRLQPQQLAAFGSPADTSKLELLVTGDSVGQLTLFLNNVDAGHTKGMQAEGHPQEYQSQPFVAELSQPDPAGVRVLAIRTWAGPKITIGRGLLSRVQVGTQAEVSEALSQSIDKLWNDHAISAMVLAFLYMCVALLGAALYAAQRNHKEYLWLALLCLTIGLGAASDAVFGVSLLPLSVYIVFVLFTGRVFMAVTLEFVLHFTGTQSRKAIRILQCCFLVLPIFSIVHLDQIYSALSVTAEIIFCGVVCVLLFNAWRRGRGDSGVMLLPFFLASTGDSIETVLDYAAGKHWIPAKFAPHGYHIGPVWFSGSTVAYAVFLGSVVAVILYRFIRISQDEQRANAEISAARSVQALLIPTQLPSNKNFMLESAYLPVHGVGGDFFQVLPLKDDSLLLVVGDVSGKGLQAAMNSSTLVGALRNELSHDPATVLEHLNHVLLGAVASPGAVPELDASPCFATCLCARIYPDGTLTIANAGHLSPYRDGRELQLPPGLPLGVIAESQYEQTTFQLNRGDRLVFLSDGVVEATNTDGELFGFERTQQVSHEPARFIAQTAKRFGQTDDITVVSLYVSSRAAKPAPEVPAYSN